MSWRIGMCTCATIAGNDPQKWVTMESLLRTGRDLETKLGGSVTAADQNMGHLEEALRKGVVELQRQALEKAVQAKADGTPPRCPQCGEGLAKVTQAVERTVETRFGTIRYRRSYGWCRKCQHWCYPADVRLGLSANASASPGLQEIAALSVSKMPVAEAAKVVERLSGIAISPATLDREARRQGQKGVEKRGQEDGKIQAGEARSGPEPAPECLVIELDAWNIRERDQWGKTERLRARGEEPGRWHWVYTGTCFGLDQRGKTSGGRAVISGRGFVATRGGLDAFREQLWAEAMRQGLGQAKRVLVIADGAVWIWKLVADRFPEAEQRLDLWHATQYLWAVAQELHPDDAPQRKAWVKPLLRQLQRDQTVQVIGRLEEVIERLPSESKPSARQAVAYLEEHAPRMKYAAARKRGEPVGSGAVESTCRQYQCRFKRPGQFWTTAGDEGLLSLETFWRNGRWRELFPHVDADFSRN